MISHAKDTLITSTSLPLVISSNCYTKIQFLSTIQIIERASYNGSIEASQASDVGSIPIARSINHDDSIVLTPLTPLKRPIKQEFLVPRWSQRNELVPTSQPEVGRRWTPVLAIGR